MSTKHKIILVISEAVLTNTFTVNTLRQLFDTMDVVTKQRFEDEMSIDEMIEFAWVCDSVGYVYGEIAYDVTAPVAIAEPETDNLVSEGEPEMGEPEPVIVTPQPKFLGIF